MGPKPFQASQTTLTKPKTQTLAARRRLPANVHHFRRGPAYLGSEVGQ